jgi:hypothetical protein
MIQTKTRLAWYLEAKADRKLLADKMIRLDEIQRAFSTGYSYQCKCDSCTEITGILFGNVDGTKAREADASHSNH